MLEEGLLEMCHWEYNTEHERWDTECGDCVCLWQDEEPKGYGFRYCPYCAHEIKFEEPK